MQISRRNFGTRGPARLWLKAAGGHVPWGPGGGNPVGTEGDQAKLTEPGSS